MDLLTNIYTTLAKGGILMIPLAICSVLAIAIIFERLINLRRSKVIPPELEIFVKKFDVKSDVSVAIKIFGENKSVFSKIVLAALENYHFSRQDLKEFLTDVGRHQARQLQSYLGVLETIAGIAPLLGLLGTVTGMIRVFSTISAKGIGEASSLSGGISEALMTTATGLAIAIPALIAYNFFIKKSEDLVVEIEKHCITLINNITVD